MKKYLLYGLMVAALALSGSVFAADEAPKKEKAAKAEGEKAEKPKAHSLTGEITALDAAAGTLTVKGKSGEKSFKAAADAKIVAAEKKDATLADLKVGDKVQVSYVEDGGANIAKKIGPAPAPKADKGEKKEKEKKTQ